MALTKCPVCKRLMSGAAPQCPKCRKVLTLEERAEDEMEAERQVLPPRKSVPITSIVIDLSTAAIALFIGIVVCAMIWDTLRSSRY